MYEIRCEIIIRTEPHAWTNLFICEKFMTLGFLPSLGTKFDLGFIRVKVEDIIFRQNEDIDIYLEDIIDKNILPIRINLEYQGWKIIEQR